MYIRFFINFRRSKILIKDFQQKTLPPDTKFIVLTDNLNLSTGDAFVQLYTNIVTADGYKVNISEIDSDVQKLCSDPKLASNFPFDVCRIDNEYYVIGNVSNFIVAAKANLLAENTNESIGQKKFNYVIHLYKDIKTLIQARLFKLKRSENALRDKEIYSSYAEYIFNNPKITDEELENNLNINSSKLKKIKKIYNLGKVPEVDALTDGAISINEAYVAILDRENDAILHKTLEEDFKDDVKKWVDKDKYKKLSDEDIVAIFKEKQNCILHEKIRELDDRELKIKESEDNKLSSKRFVFTLGVQYILDRLEDFISEEDALLVIKNFKPNIDNMFENNTEVLRVINLA